MRFPERVREAFYEFEKFGGVGVLELFGDLTARNHGELRKALLMSLDNSDHLVVNCRNVSLYDDSFRRHMAALRQASRRMRKALTINAGNRMFGFRPE